MEHLHPADRPRVFDARESLHVGRLDQLSIEYRFQHPTQGQKWLQQLAGVAARSADGHAIRTFGVVRDITELKHAEQAARDLSGRLLNAQEQERARLARELHDDITQRLARLAIDVSQLERGTSPTPSTETARGVREGLIQLSEDVHALSYRLHHSLLEDLGLSAALTAEAERFTRHESTPVEVMVRDLPKSLPQHAALCLFRVAQEALRNVARHAQARRVELSLRGLDDGLELAVRDDGIGFDPARNRARPSLGLASMRERVHLLGGELDLDTAPGRGTTIVAWVPLGEESKAEG
jgi:signal transduction histidine kinase